MRAAPPGLPGEDEPLPPAPWLHRPWPFFALVSVVVVATLGALIFRPVLAAIPMVALTALWLIWKAPLRWSAFGLFFLVLALECWPEVPYDNHWQSPLTFPGKLLFEKLNNLGAGVPLPMVDILLFLLLGIMVYRRATRSRVDPPVTPLPLPLVLALGVTVLAIAWIEARGLARGGLWRPSQWQFHQVLLLPLIVMLFNGAVRGPEDYRTVAKLIVAGAFIKAFLGAYFIVFVARPRGLAVEYATTHSDTVLYVTGMMLAITQWMEDPCWRRFRWLALIGGVIFMGMHYNDRRLAYVSLNMSLIAAFLISPWHQIKRSVVRWLVVLLPVIPLYLTVGWQNPTGIFSPIRPFKTILEGENLEKGQKDYRDLENYDVIMTWQENPVLGTGFGHPFLEVIQLPDISKYFEDYLYHPHNSVLGTCAFGGILGFTGLWIYLPVLVFLAVRAYHLTHPPEQRAAMLTVVAVVASYTNQCYGDMGIISWLSTFVMGMAIVCAGKQAILTGAWPRPARAGHPHAGPGAVPGGTEASGQGTAPIISPPLMLKPHEPRRGKRAGKKAKANRSPEPPGAQAASGEHAARPFQVKLGGKGESKAAASPPGATDSVLLHLWSRLSGGRQLSSLAVIPSHPGGSGLSVAQAILEVGRRQRAAPLRLINAEGLQLGEAAEMIRELNETTASGAIAVVVVDSVLANPVGLEVVLAVQHALLCVDLGTTDLESARRTIERVGRERFVGSVTLRAEGSS